MRMNRGTWAVLGVAVVAVAAQLVPYGRSHENRQAIAEPHWDSPATRALAERACFDCHSNETVRPRYARIAPASWLIQHDVTEGRSVLNFSEWHCVQREAGEAAQETLEGEMPPLVYRLMHPEARLTVDERQQLARGLTATLQRSPDCDGTR
jgi:hypothetical protein